MHTAAALSLYPLRGLPLFHDGDDVAAIVLKAVDAAGLSLVDGDILALAQKIVSKAEGREVALHEVSPSAEALRLADITGKDARLVELILRESSEILRVGKNMLIARTRLGFVQAHAGIDQSNVDHGAGEKALLLPQDPDASAARIRAAVRQRAGVDLGVIIVDSMNRPWRLGSTGAAIGCAGIRVLEDHRGNTDLYGRRLRVKTTNRADNLAAAANLVMGECADAVPAVLLRGLPPDGSTQVARDIVRPPAEDLFR